MYPYFRSVFKCEKNVLESLKCSKWNVYQAILNAQKLWGGVANFWLSKVLHT